MSTLGGAGTPSPVHFDRELRRYVYDHFVRAGRAPTTAEAAAAWETAQAEIKAAYRRLADGKALVLQPESGEVLMAEPFSAVPTPFLVESGGRSWYGNCIWDALGIPAMLGEDARVVTACGDCGEAMTVTVEDGAVAEASGVVHFLVPARHWWKDVVFT